MKCTAQRKVKEGKQSYKAKHVFDINSVYTTDGNVDANKVLILILLLVNIYVTGMPRCLSQEQRPIMLDTTQIHTGTFCSSIVFLLLHAKLIDDSFVLPRESFKHRGLISSSCSENCKI